MQQTLRTFELSGGPLVSPITLADKAKCVVDGMGTRIYNLDGTIAFSSASTAIVVIETGSTSVETPETGASES